MATATSNQPCDNSSVANFNAWAGAIDAAIVTTCGWTLTSDTGQTNPATTGSVPSSTYIYRVYRDTNSLIYMKFEYGFSSTDVRVRVTVGTGSNGSGTITGAIAFSALVITNSGSGVANQGATTFPCYFSGDSKEFRMLMWIGNSTTSLPMFFAIERSKDSSGVSTSDYATCLFASGSNGGTRQGQQTILPGSSLVTTKETAFITLGLTTNSGTASFNGTVAAFPFFPLIGKLGNPMLGAMSVVSSDVADAATITVASMYGSTHTYISCKSGGGFAFSQVGRLNENGAAMSLLVRYE